MHVFGSSGVRGVAGTELTPSFVLRVTRAVGYVLEGDRVALARDTRASGPTFANAAASGLTAAGLNVDRLGVVPTPCLQHYCATQGVPGVMVTASHNPPEYNGLKVVGDDGVELDRSKLDRIEAAIEADHPPVEWAATGTTRRVEGAAEDYADSVVEAVAADRLREAGLTVVVDPGHGAAYETSPAILRRLGCTVHTVNAQPDGTFPGRDPEPVEQRLEDLEAQVRATDADLGVAHDGDGDRAMFVDEHGDPVDGDAAFAALVADAVGPDDVVVGAVNVSQRVRDVVAAAGGRLSITPIGSTNIVTRVRELLADGEHVAIAGEGNGGVIVPSYRLARDGTYTAARFLELVADRPASELVADHAGYELVRESLPYGDEAARDRMIAAIADVAADADVTPDTTDGYRLAYEDSWVLARPSGTEPVVRVYAESPDRDRARELVARFADAARAARD